MAFGKWGGVKDLTKADLGFLENLIRSDYNLDLNYNNADCVDIDEGYMLTKWPYSEPDPDRRNETLMIHGIWRKLRALTKELAKYEDRAFCNIAIRIDEPQQPREGG